MLFSTENAGNQSIIKNHINNISQSKVVYFYMFSFKMKNPDTRLEKFCRLNIKT